MNGEIMPKYNVYYKYETNKLRHIEVEGDMSLEDVQNEVVEYSAASGVIPIGATLITIESKNEQEIWHYWCAS